ncbi:MAG: M23 family metallopeptidase [Bacteroidales bacterium]|jgi:murein DD-endopeptidase MepM/ murein hydrolase activator NlpD|nr:M23 family metallopeptidase [Bacteroidales bacterium]
MAKRKKKENWYRKITNRFRLVIFDDQTFEERFTMRLTTLNILIFLVSVSIVMIFITFFIIANTGIREYIPGYPDVNERNRIVELNLMADSLLYDIQRKDMYIQNIKNVLEDNIPNDSLEEPEVLDVQIDTAGYKKSVEDSLLRAEFQYQLMYGQYFSEQENQGGSDVFSIRSFSFFPPINGIITSKFNAAEKHYGIDIVTSHNEAIKATLDGTVIYGGWTLETGYALAIQHPHNLISIYKHNSVLLKKEGDHVYAGDPIGIAGSSGELSTGPHLHFELWYNGTPVNPEEYIIFN